MIEPHRSRDSSEPPEAVLRVGLVGVGRWGRNLLRVLDATPRCRVVAACDSEPAVRAALGRSHPELPLCGAIESLLAMPFVDAVALATPSATHAKLSLRALAASKHVFVEKPLARNLQDALDVHASVKATGKKLMVGHVLEYHPAVTKLKALVESGTLGRVRFVSTERFGSAFTGTVDAWWELAPHDFSVIRLITGQVPETIAARRTSRHTVSALACFPGGARARIDVGRSQAEPKVRRALLAGDEGVAIFDDVAQTPRLDVYRRQAGLEQWIDEFEASCFVSDRASYLRIPAQLPGLRRCSLHVAGEPLAIEAAHFVAAILDSSELRSDSGSGIAVVAALEAGARSMLEGGRPIRVQQKLTPALRQAARVAAHGSAIEL